IFFFIYTFPPSLGAFSGALLLIMTVYSICPRENIEYFLHFIEIFKILLFIYDNQNVLPFFFRRLYAIFSRLPRFQIYSFTNPDLDLYSPLFYNYYTSKNTLRSPAGTHPPPLPVDSDSAGALSGGDLFCHFQSTL